MPGSGATKVPIASLQRWLIAITTFLARVNRSKDANNNSFPYDIQENTQ